MIIFSFNSIDNIAGRIMSGDVGNRRAEKVDFVFFGIYLGQIVGQVDLLVDIGFALGRNGVADILRNRKFVDGLNGWRE